MCGRFWYVHIASLDFGCVIMAVLPVCVVNNFNRIGDEKQYLVARLLNCSVSHLFAQVVMFNLTVQ